MTHRQIQNRRIHNYSIPVLGLVNLITLFTIVSCNEKDKFYLSLNRIYSDVLVSKTSIALSKDTMFILEDLSTDDNNAPGFIFRKVVTAGDSLKKISMISDNNGNEETKIRTEISNKDFFINAIEKYQFSYAGISDSSRSISQKNTDILLTRDYSSPTLRLQVSIERGVPKTSFNIPIKSTSFPEFILYDIDGDSRPEFFLFTSNYFMGRDIYELEVYRITDNLTKKAF